MRKDLFTSVIEKHLTQEEDKIKWLLKEGILEVTSVINTGKTTVLCEVSANNYPLDNSEAVICDTRVLIKMMSAFSDDIKISFLEEHGFFTKIMISDHNFEASYALAHLNTMEEIPYVVEPSAYEIELDITDELFEKILKSKKANSEAEILYLHTKDNKLYFVIGNDAYHYNKISFAEDISSDAIIDKMHFPADLFIRLIAANKAFETAKMRMSSEGLLNMSFYERRDESIIRTIYYLVPFENI